MKPEHIEKVVGATVRAALNPKVRTATSYLTPTYRIRVTRRHQDEAIEFVLCMGAPAFLERRFVKRCKKQGLAFPLAMQLRHWAA